MSNEVGLIGTIDKILAKTEDTIVSELDKTVHEAKSTLKASKQSMMTIYDTIIDDGKKEAEKIEKQIVGSSSLEARNKQIMLVEDAISSVLDKALEKLRSSDTDPTLLKSLIKQATQTLGTTNVTISSNSKDADNVKSALADFEGSKFDEKPLVCLGGIIARANDASMSFDNTIDARLDRMKPLIRKNIALKFGLD